MCFRCARSLLSEMFVFTKGKGRQVYSLSWGYRKFLGCRELLDGLKRPERELWENPKQILPSDESVHEVKFCCVTAFRPCLEESVDNCIWLFASGLKIFNDKLQVIFWRNFFINSLLLGKKGVQSKIKKGCLRSSIPMVLKKKFHPPLQYHFSFSHKFVANSKFNIFLKMPNGGKEASLEMFWNGEMARRKRVTGKLEFRGNEILFPSLLFLSRNSCERCFYTPRKEMESHLTCISTYSKVRDAVP